MGGDNYVHDYFRHSTLPRLSVETWVSDCEANVIRAFSTLPPYNLHKRTCFPGPCHTHCGETWLKELSLKPKMQEKQ